MERRDTEERDRIVAEGALKKVVIVSDAREDREMKDFCSGFVAAKSVQSVYVVTSVDFVKDREEHLKVCFFDGVQISASVICQRRNPLYVEDRWSSRLQRNHI